MDILDDVIAGRLDAGERLPTEVQLAERYDVSRGVARECVRALEERGVVRVKHGGATTVNPRGRWDLFDPDILRASLAGAGAAGLLAEYLECRRIIEIDAAGLAAERATDTQRSELRDRFDAMVVAVRQRSGPKQEQAYHAADVAFHQSIIDATGNLPLASLVRRIHEALLAARYPLARPSYRRERAIPEHEAILRAVEVGDAGAARAAMAAHLDTVEGYLHEHARRVARTAQLRS